jgi:hypothetical protein
MTIAKLPVWELPYPVGNLGGQAKILELFILTLYCYPPPPRQTWMESVKDGLYPAYQEN